METFTAETWGSGSGWRGAAQTRRETDREKDRGGRRRERGAETAAGAADADALRKGGGRKARGAGPSGRPSRAGPRAPAPFPAGLPPAARPGRGSNRSQSAARLEHYLTRAGCHWLAQPPGRAVAMTALAGAGQEREGRCALLVIPSLPLSIQSMAGPRDPYYPKGPRISPQGERQAPAAPRPKLLQKCPSTPLPQPSPSSSANPTPPPSPGTDHPSIHPANSGEHPSLPGAAGLC